MATFPDVFPGGWDRLPNEVKQYLGWRAIAKQLDIQGGASGLIEWLYRGEQRPGLEEGKVAHRAGVIRYTATAMDLWPLVVADTQQFLAERAARKAQLSEESR